MNCILLTTSKPGITTWRRLAGKVSLRITNLRVSNTRKTRFWTCWKIFLLSTLLKNLIPLTESWRKSIQYLERRMTTSFSKICWRKSHKKKLKISFKEFRWRKETRCHRKERQIFLNTTELIHPEDPHKQILVIDSKIPFREEAGLILFRLLRLLTTIAHCSWTRRRT